MKLITTLVLGILLFSCENKPKYQRDTPDNTKLNLFVKSFQSQNPSWGQNDIINARIDKKFKESLFTYLKENDISELEVKCHQINEYKKGKYAVFFDNTNTSLSDGSSIRIEIIGLVPDSLMAKLQQDQNYKLKGHFKHFVNKDLSTYFQHGFFNVPIGLTIDTDSSYSLGISLFNVSSISPSSQFR